MRIVILAFAALFPLAVNAQPGNRPMDLAFWQDVVDVPQCTGQTLAIFLRDPRGRVHCGFADPGQQRQCQGRAGQVVAGACGAGLDYMRLYDCVPFADGRSDLERAIECVHGVGRRARPLEFSSSSRPSSRFRLQSEEPIETKDRASDEEINAAISPFSPRTLGLNSADLANIEDADLDAIARQSAVLLLDLMEATLASLPEPDQIERLTDLSIPARVHAVEMQREITETWSPELIDLCRVVVDRGIDGVLSREEARADMRCFGFFSNGLKKKRLSGLFGSAGRLFGLLEPG